MLDCESTFIIYLRMIKVVISTPMLEIGDMVMVEHQSRRTIHMEMNFINFVNKRLMLRCHGGDVLPQMGAKV